MRFISVAVVTGTMVFGAATNAMAQQTVDFEVHVAGLRSLEPAQRVTAIQALGESRDPAAVAPLSGVLRSDPSAVVRGWAVRALAQIGTPEANATVAATAQRDADERVRSLAAQLSGQILVTPGPVVSPQAVAVEPMALAPTPQTRRPRRRGLGLIIGGWAAFGFAYMIALTTGALTLETAHIDTWPLFVPMVGGIVEMSFAYNFEGDDWDYYPPGASIPAFINAIIQIAGVALATTGHVLRARSRAATRDQGRTARRFALVPSGPDGPGLSFMGAF